MNDNLKNNGLKFASTGFSCSWVQNEPLIFHHLTPTSFNFLRSFPVAQSPLLFMSKIQKLQLEAVLPKYCWSTPNSLYVFSSAALRPSQHLLSLNHCSTSQTDPLLFWGLTSTQLCEASCLSPCSEHSSVLPRDNWNKNLRSSRTSRHVTSACSCACHKSPPSFRSLSTLSPSISLIVPSTAVDALGCAHRYAMRAGKNPSVLFFYRSPLNLELGRQCVSPSRPPGFPSHAVNVMGMCGYTRLFLCMLRI